MHPEARPRPQRVLFHRFFGGYTGGHGKVHDYFNHVRSHPGWWAQVHMDPASSWDDNPWRDDPDALSPSFDPEAADVLFLGGMDWLQYPVDHHDKPVINLVQHVRHADPDEPLFQFLDRRAIRICVSEPVAHAIQRTGRVRGPVVVIDAALNLPPVALPAHRSGVFIDAIKRPSLGRRIADLLSPHCDVLLSDRRLPRSEYLGAMVSAEVVLTLPHDTEGFYLPALEAMSFGCAVVVGDCVGNRAYLRPGVNALVADDAASYATAARTLLADPDLRTRLEQAARQTANAFGLERERKAFHRVLDAVDELWSNA